jgi:serine/threonine-protein kinase RsbW
LVASRQPCRAGYLARGAEARCRPISIGMVDKHILTVRGRYSNVHEICEFVLAGARTASLAGEALFHIELACDEACTNIIEHAYGGEDKGDIEVHWWVNNDHFGVMLRDNGRSFDPSNIPVPAISEISPLDGPDDLQVGGLGIHFMRTLMDEVRYSFDPVMGNSLTMIKRLHDE